MRKQQYERVERNCWREKEKKKKRSKQKMIHHLFHQYEPSKLAFLLCIKFMPRHIQLNGV
uniref:Uncharacterized protein n=1 Tax=Rhizophora mucronata TaxID=61149 RepID=A0A2P2N253_RHIMU